MDPALPQWRMDLKRIALISLCLFSTFGLSFFVAYEVAPRRVQATVAHKVNLARNEVQRLVRKPRAPGHHDVLTPREPFVARDLEQVA